MKLIIQEINYTHQTKDEPCKELIQDASDDIALEPTSTSSSNTCCESDPPKLDEMFANAIEAMIDGEMSSTQIDVAIYATNSLFALISSTTTAPELSMEECIQKLHEMEYYYSITEVKKFTDKKKQITLSIMQIFILLKLAQLFPNQGTTDNIIEDVCAHLRSISLTASHAMMKSFLEVALVERYSANCGKVLYEIHNELMLPVPESLENYLKEDEDTTFSDSVLLSCGSFMSQSSSNVGSSKSCRAADTKPRHQRFSSASSSRLRRIIKIPNQSKDQSSKAVDGVKTAADNKKEKRKLYSGSESSTKTKARSIKRDLFSVQDKRTNKKPIFGSPESKKRCNISVIDTPHVKQRMTALTRQRLRLHKQRAMEKEIGGTKIIEESPAKTENESSVAVDQRMKLTRKHSFYCEGMDSRNVTRAKSLQQHNQAVLATPLINNATKGLSRTNEDSGRKYKSNLGRRSLHCLLNLPVKSPSTPTRDRKNCDENRGFASPNSRMTSIPFEDIANDVSAVQEDDPRVWNTPKSKRPLFVSETPERGGNGELENQKNELLNGVDEDCEPFSEEKSEDNSSSTDVDMKPFLRRSRRKRKLFSSISE